MDHTASEKSLLSARYYDDYRNSDAAFSENDMENALNTKRLEKSYHLSLFVSLACFSAFGFIAGMAGSRYWTMNTATFCTQEVSRYSPILEDMNMKYDVVQFNGLEENVFRKSAGAEVDEAWRSLGVDYRSVVIPAEVAAKSGLKPDQVKVSEKYGGGHLANVEGLQHLNCLNLLRQSLYYNYEYYQSKGEGVFEHDETVLQDRISQCLDVLRQQLMCTVDTGVQGQNWANPSSLQASTDYNTKHKCRNFDAIRDWAEKHQVPAKVPRDYLQTPESKLS